MEERVAREVEVEPKCWRKLCILRLVVIRRVEEIEKSGIVWRLLVW